MIDTTTSTSTMSVLVRIQVGTDVQYSTDYCTVQSPDSSVSSVTPESPAIGV